jgi:alkaline phosphatase
MNHLLRALISLGAVILAIVPAAPRAAGHLTPAQATDPPPAVAQNIILLIGDGMGPAHRTAARYLAVGPAGTLAMDQLSISGYARTHSANDLITDSAAAATALASGVKTYNGAIGVAADGTPVQTILERAQLLGKSTGLVTTTQVAHATPAAFAAHVASRNMMTEIAGQMLDHEVDVILGGGEDEWLPDYETGCYSQTGERTDGVNLIDAAVAAGYTYVCTAVDFDAVDPAATSRLLGLFADEGMQRPYAPTLADMTAKVIDILSRDADGFFLVVEGGQIDWASHGNDASNALGDTVAFDAAVAAARQYADSDPRTLVIVTADHETGGLTVEGPNGASDFTTPQGQSFGIDWTSGGHTSVEVPVLAAGPHAGGLTGTYENTHIFDVMAAAFVMPYCPTLGDLNGDNTVDVGDLQIGASNWHRACSR